MEQRLPVPPQVVENFLAGARLARLEYLAKRAFDRAGRAETDQRWIETNATWLILADMVRRERVALVSPDRFYGLAN